MLADCDPETRLPRLLAAATSLNLVGSISATANGLPCTLLRPIGVDQELGADQHAAAGPGSVRERAPSCSASRISPRLRGNGFRYRRWAWATALPCSWHFCTAVAHAPYVPPQLSTSRSPLAGPSTSCGGMSWATLRHFLRPRLDHVLVILGVVADVAGDVLLFQAADAVHQARRAGKRPRPRQPLVALYGRNVSPSSQRAGMLDRHLAATC